ncbi:DUF6292 family protein [Saccharopolyspora sp. NPDC049426]|uniref:DUF6292 family protein n=1 Tax=Saccharopolyspora sp. NPDC049426 TaxID=3155652 RepID=UPI003449963D
MVSPSETAWALERGLDGYVQAVAAALEVPIEATSFEISDTATAYLGLAHRAAERPREDLMLVWSEQQGWSVMAETDPAEAPKMIAEFGSYDRVPEPRTVARFARDVMSGHRPAPERSTFRGPAIREELARQLTPYAAATGVTEN